MNEPRTCGPCQVCCNAFHIDELPEASLRWQDCVHQGQGGCGIYKDRPGACVNFRCAWLDGWGSEDDRPDLLGVMVELLPGRPRIDLPERALVTETAPQGARSDRVRARLLALREERRVILVPHRARGFENLGKELPDDF